jgi:competence ComEA-like helix-hairpin-helix protein
MLHAQQDAAQAPSAASAEAEFPEGTGRETFVNACSECHEAGLATESRQSREGWKKVVAAMEERGAMLTKEDIAIVVDYLTQHFGMVLNLNTSRAKEIGSFLKLSPEEAAAIVRYRDGSGHFKSWDDLPNVPGLDVKKIEGKKDAITF